MQDIKIVRSMKTNAVSIRILPDAGVKVTIPYFYPIFLVNKLLKEKEAWIRQKQQLILARKRDSGPHKYYYLGQAYEIGFRPGQEDVVVVADKLYLASQSDKYKVSYLTSWYKKQARKIIVARVNLLSSKSGDRFTSIGITTADTRWGSCSSRKTLNFNWKLVMAPLEVIDYVIAHELAHLTNLNHSRDFWERVRKIYPLYREYRTWLKRNGHLLTVE